jgi:hypothetical protein
MNWVFVDAGAGTEVGFLPLGLGVADDAVAAFGRGVAVGKTWAIVGTLDAWGKEVAVEDRLAGLGLGFPPQATKKTPPSPIIDCLRNLRRDGFDIFTLHSGR